MAPVFLLTGIAGLLGVMANRLARIIDRAREVGRRKGSFDAATVSLARAELTSLERRRHLASWAINFCTGAALLVCTVIVTLFIKEFLGTELKWLAGALISAEMLSVIAGLSCFQAEVYAATHSSQIDVQALDAWSPAQETLAV